MNSRPQVGVVGVSVEGALLCIRMIQAIGEQRNAPVPVSLHMHGFAPYALALSSGDRHELTRLLLDSIRAVYASGATVAVIPANAVHVVIDDLHAQAPIPVISMLDVVTAACTRRGLRHIGVLGTTWIMKSKLYDAPLTASGIQAHHPEPHEQQTLHEVITNQLHHNVILEDSTRRLIAITERMRADGCDGILLACTELPMCLNDANCGIPALDTTQLLADAAFVAAFEGSATRPDA